ncbi:MAG: hypothetical protein QW710_05330 [Pyrobaculum sp.]
MAEMRRLLPFHIGLAELLSRVRGIAAAGVSVEFNTGRLAPNFADLMEVFDQWLAGREADILTKPGAGQAGSEDVATRLRIRLRLLEEHPLRLHRL